MTDQNRPPSATPKSPVAPATGRHGGRRRIRRQLQLCPDRAAHNEPPRRSNLVVTFNHANGDPADSYDFSKLDLLPDVATLLADAFQHGLKHLAPVSRSSYWSSLHRFARFARQTSPRVTSLKDLDTHLIMRYLDWLHAQINTKTGDPLAHSSIAHYFGELRQIFRAAKALPGDRLPKVVLFPSCLVPNRAPPAPTLPLHANHIRTILDQCYYEIDETMHRFELGLQLLASPHPTQDQDPVLHQLVHAIAELTSSGSPSLEALSARGFHSSTIEEYGTLTVLRSYVAATVDSLTPFYVALLIQTSANPEPFRNILRNCVEPHPLEDNHRIVFWQKPRAGHQCKRIQGRSFDIRKKRAAPNLITAIREITRPLAPTIKSKDPVPLFLVRTNVTPRKQIVSYESFIYSVIKFCNRANRRIEQWNQQNPDKPKEPIPKFTLRQLRFSTAAIQYEATGGDIRHVSRILNHRNVSTTISYVDSPRTQRLREKVIASSQRVHVPYGVIRIE